MQGGKGDYRRQEGPYDPRTQGISYTKKAQFRQPYIQAFVRFKTQTRGQ